MNKERLLALADYMHGVKRTKYDQGSFADDLDPKRVKIIEVEARNVNEESDYHRFQPILEEGFCGTTACVFGHAAFVPALIEAGLYIRVYGKELTNKGLYGSAEIAAVDSEGREVTDYDAAVHIFGIDYDHACLMFGGSSPLNRHFWAGKRGLGSKDITPKMIAKALRKYVATDGKSLQDLLNDGY